MEEITIESNHLSQYTDLKGKKKKTILKAMINTRNSKRTNMKILKKDLKIIKCGGRKVRKI